MAHLGASLAATPHTWSNSKHPMSTSKPLQQLTRHEYATLKDSGHLWELYPQATGTWSEDCARTILVPHGFGLRALSVPSARKANQARPAVSQSV